MLTTNNKQKYKICAFTLAEVLITLGIIGVVSAITIPSLLSKYKEKQTATILKETYSILNQGYKLTIADDGDPEGWNWPKEAIDNFTNHLKKVQECDKGFAEACFSTKEYKTLNDEIYRYSPNKGYQYKLINGVAFSIVDWDDTCSQNCGSGYLKDSFCAYIMVDINGDRNPNKLGIDFFPFLATRYGIYPAGMPAANGTCSSLNSHCDINTKNISNGMGCTAWVIEKGNMDYLRRKVSW